jgi:hypothetical protein
MDRSYFLYVQEITDFLKSVVIKFNPFVTLFNQNYTYINVPGYDENDPTTFPYYRILTGDTAFASQTLYGYSPNLREEIILDKNTINNYPDVIAFYKSPSNLKLLLNRYPDDQFIIRRLFNPVTDIDAAINANNLTILPTKYEDQYLNEYERSSLLIFLQTTLWRIDYRWYMNPLEFEDMYPYVFWGMLWNTLPMLLLTKRILNIKTVDVHPFHIWEYLKSIGFGSYKGYLTRNQEMFLYRNARYLKFHAGKKFLLDILEEVFLYPLKYSLSKRNILAHTYEREDMHDKYPDIIPTTSANIGYQSSTAFSNLLTNIYEDGYDQNNDLNYLNSVIDSFIKAPVNRLSTKFLAFDRNIDMSELMLLLRFILDEVMFLNNDNKLLFTVDVRSPFNQNVLQFDNVVDALSLFYYCIYKRNDDPQVPFTKYSLTTALTHSSAPTIDKSFLYNELEYFIPPYIDLDDLLSNVPFITESLFLSKDLSVKLGDIYLWLFAMINTLKAVSECIEHEMYHHIFTILVPKCQVIDVTQSYETYDAFFEKYPEALEEISNITDDAQYAEMMYAILTGICPLDYGFAALARDDEVVSILIHKIKELFMYMVSYNITFLNPPIERTVNLEIPKIVLQLDRGIPFSDGSFNKIISSFSIVSNEDLDTLSYRMSVNKEEEKIIDLSELDLEHDVEVVETSFRIDAEVSSKLDKLDVNYNLIIYTTFEGSEVTFLNTI